MSDHSKIQWTTATWNPVTGCTQIPGAHGGPSGCDNCYAKKLIDTRQVANPRSLRFGHPFEEVMLHEDRLDQPLRWKRPRKIFVNSLSDLFHADVPDDFIDEVFFAMMLANWHVYQVLTKRPERMKRYMIARSAERIEERGDGFQARLPAECQAWPPPNVHLGVSISSNDDAWRANMLRETPAAVRFLSLEPLLGPVDKVAFYDLSWIIVGGESGSNWRPMELDWAREILWRCQVKRIPFFFKQVSAFRPTDAMIPDDLRVREWPVAA